MRGKFSKVIKVTAPLILLVAGIAATVVLIKTGPKPVKRPAIEREYLVNAFAAVPVDVTPMISGYGEVAPDRTWKAVAQVSGKIVWKSPKLKSGDFFKKGELMLRIDEQEVSLAIQKNRAEIKKYLAKIAELKSHRINMESRLEILRKVHGFNKSKLNRQKKLLKSEAVASVSVEEEEINVLTQQSALVELETSIRLIPAQIDYQKAELAAALANMKQSELDLSYTKVTAPFACRVRTVSVEEGQYVTVGQEMFVADATDKVEIPVQFSMDQLASLINPSGENRKNLKDKKNKRAPDDWDITVKVNGGFNAYSWKGKFLRIASGVDTTTRMISMIIGVSDPYKRNNGKPGPPLDRGLFCSVTIRGKTIKNLLVVPRYALHNGSLYIANKDSRLEIRPVKTGASYEQYTVVKSGLKPGETVILSDIVPAIKGMKLKLRMDKDFAAKAQNELSAKKVKND